MSNYGTSTSEQGLSLNIFIFCHLENVGFDSRYLMAVWRLVAYKCINRMITCFEIWIWTLLRTILPRWAEFSTYKLTSMVHKLRQLEEPCQTDTHTVTYYILTYNTNFDIQHYIVELLLILFVQETIRDTWDGTICFPLLFFSKNPLFRCSL